MLHSARETLTSNGVSPHTDRYLRSLVGAAMGIAALSNQKWNVNTSKLYDLLLAAVSQDCCDIYLDVYGRPVAYVISGAVRSCAATGGGRVSLDPWEGDRSIIDFCFVDCDPMLVGHLWLKVRPIASVQSRMGFGSGRSKRTDAAALARFVSRNLELRYGGVLEAERELHVFDVGSFLKSSNDLGLAWEALHELAPTGWSCVVKAQDGLQSAVETGYFVINAKEDAAGTILWRPMEVGEEAASADWPGDMLTREASEGAGTSEQVLIKIAHGEIDLVGVGLRSLFEDRGVESVIVPGPIAGRLIECSRRLGMSAEMHEGSLILTAGGCIR